MKELSIFSGRCNARKPELIINAPEPFVTIPPDGRNKYYLIIYDSVINR